MIKMDLIDIQKRLEDAIHNAFDGPCWVRAEINNITVSKGHCYLELVQKDKATNKLLAKAHAVIWASRYALLEPFFRTATGMHLQAGIQVLLSVEPNMHPLYGLSLVVVNIDPSYTMGDIEAERKKTWDRLLKEGVVEMNKQLPFPDVPLSLAVISSSTAAGYQDFADHITKGGFAFKTVLFPALMQGDKSPDSIIEAMEKVMNHDTSFDVLLILRGGGAVTDLHSYDNYNLAAHIAQFPIPVITGVGHHKDVHIADKVAHLSLKTPTAVADFLNNHLEEEEQEVVAVLRSLEKAINYRLESEKKALEHLLKDVERTAAWTIRNHLHKLELLEQRIESNNPLTVLKKGYSLTLFQGKALLNTEDLKPGHKIETVLFNGSIASVVDSINEK